VVLPGILKIDLNKRKQHSVGGNNNDKRHKRVISNSQWFFALRIIRLSQVRHREALRFTGPNDRPAAPVGALIPIKSVLNANGPSRTGPALRASHGGSRALQQAAPHPPGQYNKRLAIVAPKKERMTRTGGSSMQFMNRFLGGSSSIMSFKIIHLVAFGDPPHWY